MKIASVIGARPQFVKCSILSKELRKRYREIIIHTGQHYDYELSKVFFNELNIAEPNYNLAVGSHTHGYQLGEMVKKIEEVLIKLTPDLVLVYGDTNTTLAGALAAAKLQIKVGHIEAGLRSFDKTMAEEINRELTDHCSSLLFCPTQTAVTNLKNEHVLSGVYLTGNVMADALLANSGVIEKSGILEELGLKSEEYLLATIHRQSNTDNKESLAAIVNTFYQVEETIVLPLHPRTEKYLKKYGLYSKLAEKIKVVKPLGYIEFQKLLSHASKVLTDSGSVQIEAYIVGIPCITLRENTEWVETVEDGWNVLAGTDSQKIVLLAEQFKPAERRKNLFAPGASESISRVISDSLD